MTGIIKSVKMVANRATVNYAVTITVSSDDKIYTINMINLLQLLKKVGEYPSVDVNSDLSGYEIEFTADSFDRISNIALVEVEEVGT